MLQKLLIRNHEQVHDPKVRESYGILSSIFGIVTNLSLSTGKFIAGTISGSIAITSDAWNNLTDAISSLISLLSFRLSTKPPDADHPFGHARTEYIASSAVALIILLVAYELAKESINRILHPIQLEITMLAIGVLVASILVKLGLWYEYRQTARLINSQVLRATAADSLSDVMATSTVLISSLISRFTSLRIDGWISLLVAGLIFLAGIRNLGDTLKSILGTTPPDDLVELIEKEVLSYNGVLAVHDLVVHEYGPGRIFATVHVEVDGSKDVMVSHDLIDNIEREVALKTGIHLVIHMDPLLLNDPIVNQKRQEVLEIIQSIESNLSIHDFRMVRGETHTNLIFDVLVPDRCEIEDQLIKDKVIEGIRNMGREYFAVVTVDRSYIGLPSHNLK